MGSRYGVSPDEIAGSGTSRDLLLTMAAGASRVLDVGCSTGGLAAALTERGATVVGLDIDEAAVAVARGRGVDARVADLEAAPLSAVLPNERFDCVVFGDVLEHLVDPGAALLDSRRLLQPDGCVLVSVPNVSNASVRLALLVNRWDGRDIGLLDRTHLRFFTLESFTDLAASAGFAVARVERVRSDTRDPDQEHVLALKHVDLVPEALVEAAHYGPEADTLQFVFRLEPLDIGEVDSEVARLAAVRARVELRDAMREVERLQQQIQRLPDPEAVQLEQMKMRDAMIGLGAELAEARAQVREWEYRYGAYVGALEGVTSSLAWRIGRIATSPLRAARYVVRKIR